MIDVWGFLSGLIKPLDSLIDNATTTDEERLSLRTKALEIQTTMSNKLIDYESQLLDAKARIITAEATGASWMQRNWRPLTMLTFLALVVCDSFGLLAFRLADQAWTLLQIGLGGYVIGRSAEKIAPNISDAISSKKEQ